MSDLTKILFLCLIVRLDVYGQDLHYTNYRNVQNAFNPGSTGNFLGSIKLQGIYRGQYSGTYNNFIIGGEGNITSPLNNKHWIGLGMNISNDRAGDLNLKTRGGGVAVGYHVPLNKKSTSRIAIGYRMDMLTITSDAKNYKSELTILGRDDNDKKLLTDFKENYRSMSGGVVYYNTISKKSTIETGVALMHFNKPSFSFKSSNNKSIIGQRLNFHFRLLQSMNPKLNIEPAIYFSSSEYQTNVNLQFFTDYKINKKNNWAIVAGLGNRMGESFDLTLGYKSMNTYFTMSYDYLYGDRNNFIGNTGAIELGAYHIITLRKKPKLVPILLCPRL